ncbi:GntR family transcriptional regulator [Sinomonas sp. RB5]
MRQGKRELMGQEVAAAIRELIMTGEARPGETLRLAPLAEKLEMSLTPVREALLMLAQDGWVAHQPNRGFQVMPIRRDNVVDTYFMWAVAEGELAARAAARVTPEGLSALRGLDGRLRSLEDHHTSDALGLNAELHSAVHEMADAPKLLWFADAARRLVPLRFDSSFHSVPGWAEINREGHTPIIDCIELGDQEGARQLMRHHFSSTGDLLVRWLDTLSFWSEPSTAPEVGSIL